MVFAQRSKKRNIELLLIYTMAWMDLHTLQVWSLPSCLLTVNWWFFCNIFLLFEETLEYSWSSGSVVHVTHLSLLIHCFMCLCLPSQHKVYVIYSQNIVKWLQLSFGVIGLGVGLSLLSWVLFSFFTFFIDFIKYIKCFCYLCWSFCFMQLRFWGIF